MVCRYDTVQQSEDANGITPLDSWTVENIEKWLYQHAEAIITGNSQSLTPSVDLFDIGFDRFMFIPAFRNY